MVIIRSVVLALLLLTGSGNCVAQQDDSDGYLFGNGLFKVPLQVSDNSGVDRVDWPVRSGIPLPAGAVRDMASLTLLDEQGREVPAQFAALSRYAARDNSVRWLLMDFQVSVAANSTRQLYLTNSHPATPGQLATSRRPEQVVIAEHDGRLTVDTGPLKATVCARDGRIFDSVVINGEQIIGSNHAGGSYVRSRATEQFRHYIGSDWNTHGWEHDKQEITRRIREENYFGSASVAEMVVEERGPLHTTLRIRGTHLPPTGSDGSIADGLYNYTLRLHFYAGKSFVKVQLDIENSATEQPQWNFPFLEAGFLQDIALGPGSEVTAAFLDSGSGSYRFATTALKADNKVRIQQGSPGVARQGQNGAALSKTELLSIDGSGPLRVLDSGNIARYLDVSDDDKGLTLCIRYFWQEGPRAIEVSEGGIRLIALANEVGVDDRESGKIYDLDFGQRYINDLLLYFHGPSIDKTDMLAVAEAFEYPLVAIAPTAWYSDTETWYFEVDKSQAVAAKNERDEKHWIIANPADEFRRDKTNYNSGGHHGSLNSSWLSFLLSRSLTDYERLEAASRWHIARNPGWVYRGNLIEVTAGGDSLKEVDRKLLQWDRLAGFGPKDFYLWKERGLSDSASGGDSYFNHYKQLPDMEHYANFILFEYYLLTGDRRALDSIHGFVNWALNFQHRHLFDRKLLPLSEFDYFANEPEAMRRGHYSRIYSWMLYSTLAGYHATGSPVMDHFAIWQIRRALSLLRHRHGQFTSWDVKPGMLLAPLEPDLQRKIADHFDYPLVRKRESVYSSSAQSWMEAQNVLALHEAYKTYQDERILDALWGMADYFAHHVIFYPEIGAFTGVTGMPTPLLTGADMVAPQLHDRHIQVLPLLVHYTGWDELEARYLRVKEVTSRRRINSWFTQTRGWEEVSKAKFSSSGPDRITDLAVTSIGDDQFSLRWTSPGDDGPNGRASRYFVKVSDKPIVEFAPTDNPLRNAEKTRIVSEVQKAITSRKGYTPGNLSYSVDGVSVTPEAVVAELAHPQWHKTNAFWMAEHVDGEPVPQQAGQTEHFVVRNLNLHNRFGSLDMATLPDLDTDTLYVAVCSWDEDNNLSELSNVVKLVLR